MLTIIDADIGNLGSVAQAFQRVGIEATPSASPADLERSTGIVLPGVGAFGEAMTNLKARGFELPLLHAVKDRHIPLIGICLGMQLLAKEGHEFGTFAGLGLLDAHVEALPPVPGETIPNMGWCEVIPAGPDALPGVPNPTAFYFAHSYHMRCACTADIAATTPWGENQVVAAVRRGNIMGVQFHPEKSQDAGLSLLHAFAESIARRN
ncbi:imidazole glycerol phosphate synthase subunit HisH [Acetoanaerobium noterae]|uniref:imidazole glycerol phosphate synthase subunit HisH n=1 Tax=Acetoanaerobium noterae TaxID=745369 RepID=UPI00322176EE